MRQPQQPLERPKQYPQRQQSRQQKVQGKAISGLLALKQYGVDIVGIAQDLQQITETLDAMKNCRNFRTRRIQRDKSF